MCSIHGSSDGGVVERRPPSRISDINKCRVTLQHILTSLPVSFFGLLNSACQLGVTEVLDSRCNPRAVAPRAVALTEQLTRAGIELNMAGHARYQVQLAVESAMRVLEESALRTMDEFGPQDTAIPCT